MLIFLCVITVCTCFYTHKLLINQTALCFWTSLLPDPSRPVCCLLFTCAYYYYFLSFFEGSSPFLFCLNFHFQTVINSLWFICVLLSSRPWCVTLLLHLSLCASLVLKLVLISLAWFVRFFGVLDFRLCPCGYVCWFGETTWLLTFWVALTLI